MEAIAPYLMTISKAVLIVLSVSVLVRCIRSMLSQHYEAETWAYLRIGNDTLPVYHWENLIGRSGSCDIRLKYSGISRVHAVLTRKDRDTWKIYDIFSRGGVWVNGQKIPAGGMRLRHGDIINLGGSCLRFMDISEKQKEELEECRSSAGERISPSVTLTELSVLQIFLLLEHCVSAERTVLFGIALGFVTLLLLEWTLFNIMRAMGRSGFEVETLAFYLSTLGMSAAAASAPEDMYKQILLLISAVLLFVLNGLWLRDLRRTASMRLPAGALALILLAVNIVFSRAVFGARNWLEIGGYSFQPSELIKCAYIYVGASTLDRLYRKKNLFSFIVFSAVCVVSMALIGDFGTALIFFMGFLIISFMRSGSIATVLLAVSGAGLAGFLAVMAKPYIARRFTTWGHVWEDVYNSGYQQTRAMSAAASGGLFGKGAGQGWLSGIFAADTDMVFAVICEELGLIVALCMAGALLVLAFFAVRSARQGRSAYNAIAACAAMGMLLTQMALNVFGSLDLLPFTGVTFPFVSRGGSSLIACWMMMSFLKSSDNRLNASFAVRRGRGAKGVSDADEEYYGRSDDYLYDTDEDEDMYGENDAGLYYPGSNDKPVSGDYPGGSCDYGGGYDDDDDDDDGEGAWS